MEPPIASLSRLLQQLDNDPSLLEPHRFRQRLEVLHRLDAYLPDPAAKAAASKLEVINNSLYDTVRAEIRRGNPPEIFLQCIRHPPGIHQAAGPDNTMGYDYLDDLIAGVFQFEDPAASTLPAIPMNPEIIPYQPTPARHIFHLLGLAALTSADVLVDLGSGLGQVPLLASICTPARAIGIELEPAYVERARQSAHRLNLSRTTFLHQDARAADLSIGTVFYLYTPFTGSILRNVLDRLKRQAATHAIRIATYGPCTPVVAAEAWLESTSPPGPSRIALFLTRAPVA